MSTATTNMELDFFAMENNHHSKSHSHNLFRRQRSLKDIQSAISKIKPEILKSVINSGCVDNGKHDVIATNHNPSLSPKGGNDDDHFFQFHSLPLYSPSNSRMSSLENLPDTAPLTIFYNETVTVFHVSRDQAKSIIKVAEKGSIISKSEVEKAIPLNELQQMGYVNEELPLARKRSLHRFLEKRKERLILPWPYACHI